MQVLVYPTRAIMSAAAAQAAAAALRRVLDARPFARIAVATAASQIEFQSALSRIDGIEWPRVEVFQLDEYSGPAGRAPGALQPVADDPRAAADGHHPRTFALRRRCPRDL